MLPDPMYYIVNNLSYERYNELRYKGLNSVGVWSIIFYFYLLNLVSLMRFVCLIDTDLSDRVCPEIDKY